MEEQKVVYASLLAVQRDLKAPKNQYNSFGKYNYRSCEDILQAARPLCNENGLILTLSDEIVPLGNRFYVKATAKVMDVLSGDFVENTAYAREDEIKKGMDGAQVTGAASSYARKYCLCGLFAIDDTKDADTNEYTAQTSQKAPQQTKTYNATPNTNSMQNDAHKVAMSKLTAKVKELNISGTYVSAIIKQFFKKNNSTELTPTEIYKLKDNLAEYMKTVKVDG